MKRVRRNYMIPKSVDDWLKETANEEFTQSDKVILGLEILKDLDLEELESITNELGIAYGNGINVAIHHFNKLNLKSKQIAVAEYYRKLAG